MKNSILVPIILVASLACNPSKPKEEKVKNPLPTQEEIYKIVAALPEHPIVQPVKKRKLLVFSLAWGYKHTTIPWGKELFAAMGKKTGAFEAIVSDDISVFEPQNLERFDAVVFNNTNNEIFLPENFDSLSVAEKEKAVERDRMLKKSFVDFLQNGGGLAVLHAGVASFREWPEFGEIIGARFDNHPWSSGSTVTLKVEEPNHPLMRGFSERTFQVSDEIYQMKAPYSREKLRVLMSIDTAKTDMNKNGIHRTDGDFAMSWVKNYGKGRIFYCALGHEKHIFWQPVIVKHLLAGVQFVLGDLPADASPRLK